MTKPILYLANPFGFSAMTAAGPLAHLVTALEGLGAEVWEPFSSVDHGDPGAPQWAWRIGQANVNAVRQAAGVLAVVNGCPPDEGVMIEVGLAIAWRKPLFLFRDDFRRCSDSDAYPLNLMVFAGYSEHAWRLCWYERLEELADPEGGLVRWLAGDAVPLVAPDADVASAQPAAFRKGARDASLE